jgi:hypothetical protein
MNMNEDSETYISDLLDNLQASLCNSVLSLGSQKWIARCTLGRRDMIRPEFPNNPFQTWTTSKPIQQGADFGLRLLSQPLVQKCLILYNSTRMARTFPIIDTPCFQSTIIAFFEGHICRASEACLFAFTAFIAYHFSEVSLLIDLEKCELQARSLVPEILTQPATFDGIRTMLMLVSL